MSQPRRRYDPEFKAGAVRIVRETRRSIAEVARELGIGAGVLGNWVRRDRVERGEAEGLRNCRPGRGGSALVAGRMSAIPAAVGGAGPARPPAPEAATARGHGNGISEST